MNVGAAVTRGMDLTRAALFRPFRLERWLKLGVVFFIASFVDPTWSGYSSPSLPRFGGHASAPVAWPRPIELEWIAIGGAVAILVLSIVALAVAWVGCRGSMMAFRAVERGDADAGLGAFRELGAPADALFRSYAVVWLGAAAVLVPLAAHAFWRALSMHAAGEADEAIARALVPHAVLGALAFGATLFAAFVVRAFIAPILYRVRCTAREALDRTLGLVRSDPGGAVLYAVVRIAVGMALGLASTIVTFATCCIGALPVVHQALLAPILFFDRALALEVTRAAAAEVATPR